jgi:mRNA-degrading endonuclease RelE of RelBE toxin-antitoxin system
MAFHHLTFSPGASKAIQALRPPLRERVERALQRIVADPATGKSLKGPLQGKRSYRVGDWRIIYLVQEDTVYVETLDHRGRVYR